MKYILLLLITCSVASAQMTTKVTGYVDAFYSSTFTGSSTIPYSTQTWVDGEPVINLAWIRATNEWKSLTLQSTLQLGKYPESNYYDEDYDIRWIQDFFLKVSIDKFAVYAGIMPAHNGYASTNTGDNITVTQSLISDATPYYETGIRAEWSDSTFTGAVMVLQGWQRINDNNSEKSIGTQMKYHKGRFTGSWNTIMGNDYNPGDPWRFYSNTWAEWASEKAKIVFLADQAFMNTKAPMWYFGLLTQVTLDKTKIGCRWEMVNDRDQVVFLSNNKDPFLCQNFSINGDYNFTDMIAMRAEVRSSISPYKIFNNSNTTTYLTISSYFKF